MVVTVDYLPPTQVSPEIHILPSIISLFELVKDEKIEQRRWGANVTFDDPNADLEAFEKSDTFLQLYGRVADYSNMPHDPKKIRAYTQVQLPGDLFECLAYSMLAAVQPDDCVLLSPGRTETFFKNLDGNQYIPDGIILSTREGLSVMALCEYTSRAGISERTNWYGNKYFTKKYLSFEQLQKKLSPIFPNPQLVMVVPNNVYYPHKIFDYDSVKRWDVPYSYGQFRNYARYLYKEYAPTEGGWTFEQMQDRANISLT